MSKSFDDLLKRVNGYAKKRVAVVIAQDESVLEAVRAAKGRGIVDVILVGDSVKIKEIADKVDMDLTQFEIVDETNVNKTALEAIRLVSPGEADMVMEGLVGTATFLRSVLNKGVGLRTGRLASHVAVFEIKGIDRLILLTDAVLNTYPDLEAKVQILNNIADAAHACGIELPEVAPVCAVEVVNPDMPAIIDASLLSKMNDRRQIKGCIVDEPLALDNALSEEAAHHKGVTGKVAGKADVILLPNTETANVMYKTLTYISESRNGGLLVRTSAPVILASRADSFETEVHSIAPAALVAEAKK